MAARTSRTGDEASLSGRGPVAKLSGRVPTARARSGRGGLRRRGAGSAPSTPCQAGCVPPPDPLPELLVPPAARRGVCDAFEQRSAGSATPRGGGVRPLDPLPRRAAVCSRCSQRLLVRFAHLSAPRGLRRFAPRGLRRSAVAPRGLRRSQRSLRSHRGPNARPATPCNAGFPALMTRGGVCAKPGSSLARGQVAGRAGLKHGISAN